MNNLEYQYTLDTTGLLCPEPVMMLHEKVAAMTRGEILRVLATDPSTQRDIPKFCQMLGHQLIESSEAEGVFIFRIAKATASD
jgi:tRNA 2-thiouridine synthesizing protein A